MNDTFHKRRGSKQIELIRAAAILLLASGCIGAGLTGRPNVPAAPVPPSAGGDASSLYRKAGLLAASGPVSYIGTLGFFAGRHSDSTLSMLALSLPTRALTFVREGDRYRAEYTVRGELRRDGTTVHHFEAKELVRVVGYKETTRADESVIFQEFFSLAPGRYTLALSVRDESGARTSDSESEVVVPVVGPRGLSSAVLVHEVAPRAGTNMLPRIVASPRSTAVFGRDSLLMVYVEAYGPGSGEQLRTAIRDDTGMTLWSDSVMLTTSDSVWSGSIAVPVSPLGIGGMQLTLTRSGSGASVQTSVFVSFGGDLPLASFDDMLGYLTLYASPRRLRTLREALPAERASVWAAFLRETDPAPETSQHEALQAYFSRIQQANQDYREDGGVGWRTDRGRVFVALGAPDNVLEPIGAGLNQRNTSHVWEYHRLQVQLVFVDQTGFGRWRLTPGSEADFQTVLRREQVR